MPASQLSVEKLQELCGHPSHWLTGVQIIVLSYPWLESTHPDRHGTLLRSIADILALVASEAVAHGGEHAAAGVMIDWCSLPQKPCTDAEQEVFDRGLSEMHYWYVIPLFSGFYF